MDTYLLHTTKYEIFLINQVSFIQTLKIYFIINHYFRVSQ